MDFIIAFGDCGGCGCDCDCVNANVTTFCCFQFIVAEVPINLSCPSLHECHQEIHLHSNLVHRYYWISYLKIQNLGRAFDIQSQEPRNLIWTKISSRKYQYIWQWMTSFLKRNGPCPLDLSQKSRQAPTLMVRHHLRPSIKDLVLPPTGLEDLNRISTSPEEYFFSNNYSLMKSFGTNLQCCCHAYFPLTYRYCRYWGLS